MSVIKRTLTIYQYRTILPLTQETPNMIEPMIEKINTVNRLLALACASKQSRTCTELAKLLKVSTASITGIKDKLVADGLFVEVVDNSGKEGTPDRRVSRFQATEDGKQVVSEMLSTILTIQDA